MTIPEFTIGLDMFWKEFGIPVPKFTSPKLLPGGVTFEGKASTVQPLPHDIGLAEAVPVDPRCARQSIAATTDRTIDLIWFIFLPFACMS